MMKDLLRSPVLAAMLFLAGIVVLTNGNANGTLYKWSQTAETNSTADATINWAEGMAPSAVNDSARFMMAAVAKYRDDMAGALATTGSSNAYVLTSNQAFASLSAMSGQKVCFKPNFTNTATATLNVDTLGAKGLRSTSGTILDAGALVAGTSYCAVYDNSASEWVIAGVNVNVVVPIGAILDWPGSGLPQNFLLARGAAVNRTTYAALFAVIGTTYGAGDGSTTFNLPDLGGRSVAGSEASESRLTSAVSGCNGSTLGATCGAQSTTLTTTELPAHTHPFSATTSGGSAHLHEITGYTTHTGGSTTGLMADTDLANSTTINSGGENNHTHSVSGTSDSAGTGSAFSKVQPTIVLHKIIRAL